MHRSCPAILTVVPLAILIVAAAVGPADAQPAAEPDYPTRMEREHAGDEPVASPAATIEPAASVAAEEVVYAVLDGSEVRGYLATPADGEPTAGILLIHEWWGLNDNIRAMARRLAGEGYAALAVDLYEGEVGDTREEAATLARASRDKTPRLQENLRQARSFLQQTRGLAKIGVIGWCFGGGWSLQTALLLGDAIDAAVIYYGRVETDPQALEALTAPLLGIFGAEDQGIPVATVREFQARLDALGKQATVHIYEGADHAFANPSGTRYNEGAATDAWGKTLAFFSQHLQ